MMGDKSQNDGNLHRRFMVRVLAPPFIVLLFISIIGLWQLDGLLHNQAINELKRSSATTAVTLEREFSLREAVLKRTGADLFVIKSEYQASRQKLDENREACRAHVRQKFTFRNAPNGVCDPFLGGFAVQTNGLVAIEQEYVRLAQALIDNQNQRINERLSGFKQVFPETLALVILDSDKKLVSSALSGVFQDSIDAFQADAEAAIKSPIRGKQTKSAGFRLTIFAFPITGGCVLVAFDTLNEQFLSQTWAAAPIDRKQALTVILDSKGVPAFPEVPDGKNLTAILPELRNKPFARTSLGDVDHTLVGTPVKSSDWLVAVASPTAAVVAPARDAQLVGLATIGLLMVGFAWVGAFFIQRILRTLTGLVSGAMVFGSGRLDYKIALDNPEHEFLQLATTMNTMAERIAAAEREIDEKNKEFISVATHELRAPLSVIIGYLSNFKDLEYDKLNKDAASMIDQAYYGTVRMRDLVNDMLNVARLESGRAQFSLAPVSVKSVIDDVVESMDVVAKMTNVELSYKDHFAAPVVADEGRLRIIINNFVSNAIKYNRPGGHVVVSHLRAENQLVTVVTDDGLGIPEDQKQHMFEKFFRVEHADRSSVTGTGLGMYIVKQYIQDMNGKLWFESEHGKGSKFYVSLPLAKVKLRDKIKASVKKRLPKKKKKPTKR